MDPSGFTTAVPKEGVLVMVVVITSPMVKVAWEMTSMVILEPTSTCVSTSAAITWLEATITVLVKEVLVAEASETIKSKGLLAADGAGAVF